MFSHQLTCLLFGTLAATTALSYESATAVDKEWLSYDEDVKSHFSERANDASNITLVSVITIPVLALSGTGPEELRGDHTRRFAVTMAVDFAGHNLAKFLVRRPRPYTYNQHSLAQKLAASRPIDSHLSFYSGHSSSSFAAATAGSLMFTSINDNIRTRSIFIGTEFALASATAKLRIKSGRHFFTDVWTGVLAGTAIGYLAASRGGKEEFTLSAQEGACAVGGILLGSVLVLAQDFPTPAGDKNANRFRIRPMVTEKGNGLAFELTW